MKDVLAEAGLTVESVMSRFTMFNAYQVQERAHGAAHGAGARSAHEAMAGKEGK
jgi:hypothetical protein